MISKFSVCVTVKRIILPTIFQKLREEFLTMNGDDAAALEDPESDEDGTFKKMLRSEYYK